MSALTCLLDSKCISITIIMFSSFTHIYIKTQYDFSSCVLHHNSHLPRPWHALWVHASALPTPCNDTDRWCTWPCMGDRQYRVVVHGCGLARLSIIVTCINNKQTLSLYFLHCFDSACTCFFHLVLGINLHFFNCECF